VAEVLKKVCPVCGAEFETTSGKKKYCSYSCNREDYNHNYYLKNKEKIAEYHHNYYLKNKEKIAEYYRDYYRKYYRKTVGE